MSSKAEVHIALLRGVNVGGKNRLPMKDLAAMFTAAGCGNVRTYIQSGNVIFEAAPKLAAKIAAHVKAEIEKRFGFQTTLVMRTAAEIRAAATNNPFLQAGIPPEELALLFLDAHPTEAQVSGLDPHRDPTDRYVVCGRDIYSHHPNGVAKSKLTNAYFDSRLKTVSTGRNWRTVLQLLAMAEAK